MSTIEIGNLQEFVDYTLNSDDGNFLTIGVACRDEDSALGLAQELGFIGDELDTQTSKAGINATELVAGASARVVLSWQGPKPGSEDGDSEGVEDEDEEGTEE